MMRSYFGRWRSIFVEAGVPLTVIALTLGEVGIPSEWPSVTPEQMKQIRRNEFTHSMEALGTSGIALDHGDLRMSLAPPEPAVKDVLKIVREQQFGVLFSFHPYEVTPVFDHPDHNTAGIVTKLVAAAADVRHFYPEYPAMSERPELFFWTSDTKTATQKLPLPAGARKRRNQHLIEQYPSQFAAAEKREWTTIFDRITNGKHKHRELYVNVR